MRFLFASPLSRQSEQDPIDVLNANVNAIIHEAFDAKLSSSTENVLELVSIQLNEPFRTTLRKACEGFAQESAPDEDLSSIVDCLSILRQRLVGILLEHPCVFSFVFPATRRAFDKAHENPGSWVNQTVSCSEDSARSFLERLMPQKRLEGSDDEEEQEPRGELLKGDSPFDDSKASLFFYHVCDEDSASNIEHRGLAEFCQLRQRVESFQTDFSPGELGFYLYPQNDIDAVFRDMHPSAQKKKKAIIVFGVDPDHINWEAHTVYRPLHDRVDGLTALAPPPQPGDRGALWRRLVSLCRNSGTSLAAKDKLEANKSAPGIENLRKLLEGNVDSVYGPTAAKGQGDSDWNNPEARKISQWCVRSPSLLTHLWDDQSSCILLIQSEPGPTRKASGESRAAQRRRQ